MGIASCCWCLGLGMNDCRNSTGQFLKFNEMTALSIARRALAISIVLAFVSCSKDDFEPYGSGGYRDSAPSWGSSDDSSSSGNGGNTSAGVLTAGEWNDLDNWHFWGNMMLSQGGGNDGGGYYQYCPYWEFYPHDRVAVKVTDGDAPAAGVKVELNVDGHRAWTAVTDNLGVANLWPGLYQKSALGENAVLSISVDGKVQSEAPVVTHWSSEQTVYNSYEITSGGVSARKADIAFIVDATGSMGDEIKFLKQDLQDIVSKVGTSCPDVALRLAALFYRDEGDEYVTRSKNFTSDVTAISDFIGEQSAVGGGDYPEAVHTALEAGLQNLSWDESARSRIVFLVLDAPAHHNDDVISSIHASIENYARNGIKIIPVAASGVDKNTEFMSRFFALATSGTYVFLTDDSGVGESHIEPSVGEYKVETLNELIIRLIVKYIQ